MGVLVMSFAQNAEPVSAPTDVTLKLATAGDEHQFHLGELIPIEFSYSAKTTGKYAWISRSGMLAGGRTLQISCSPSAERVKLNSISADEVAFGQMLNEPCGGIGGGVGSACGDCDGERQLTETALTFGSVPLNTYVRFRTPDTYTCEASSAEITTASRDEKIRPALLVNSNPIRLTIVNDAAWAHSAALQYGAVYEKLCRGSDVPEHRFFQCTDVARRIIYLDTDDALAIEVKAFDGKSYRWDNGFWDAIQQSSNPKEALRLMSSRMQEADFEVSTTVVEWLASAELRMEMPDAFEIGTPATYHAQAVEKLRKYVRLAGEGLSQKDSESLAQSVKNYRTFAEQRYCEPHSLIPEKERKQVLTGVSLKP
jgi:hypothetical protein